MDRIDFEKEVVRKAFVFCDTTGIKCFVVVLIFGLHNPMLAGIEIVILWLMILKPTLSLLKSIKLPVIYYTLSCLSFALRF
jgi:tryptophan-rich sensory protein